MTPIQTPGGGVIGRASDGCRYPLCVPYVVMGIVGIIAVLLGVVLGVFGSGVGGWVVGGTGGLLTAVGLVGFGLQQRHDHRSPSRLLADEETADRLAERRAREERLRAEAEEGRQTEELRLARLRDIDRSYIWGMKPNCIIMPAMSAIRTYPRSQAVGAVSAAICARFRMRGCAMSRRVKLLREDQPYDQQA